MRHGPSWHVANGVAVRVVLTLRRSVLADRFKRTSSSEPVEAGFAELIDAA
jgi:hypothetical protein